MGWASGDKSAVKQRSPGQESTGLMTFPGKGGGRTRRPSRGGRDQQCVGAGSTESCHQSDQRGLSEGIGGAGWGGGGTGHCVFG